MFIGSIVLGSEINLELDSFPASSISSGFIRGATLSLDLLPDLMPFCVSRFQLMGHEAQTSDALVSFLNQSSMTDCIA